MTEHHGTRSVFAGSVSQSSEIPLRIRIGVTGHRNLAPDHPGLATEISKAVEYIIQKLAVSAERVTPDDIALTVVSSLAEGADRIVACEILNGAGAQLEVVLPLQEDDYCHDFKSPESVDQFNLLLGKKVSMDIVRTARSRMEAYELAGRAVVDRSDVMIVVWDGKPARGRGGTADIYAYAKHWQRPILLIGIDNDSARLDTDQLPREAEGTMPLPADSMRHLDRYNRQRFPDAAVGPPPLIDPTILRAWPEPASPLIEYVSRYFTHADELAKRFQKRWLRAVRSLYILAPLAVLVVAAQLIFAPGHARYAWFEFGILVGVTVLLIVTREARWHARWISARYLAEQIRSLMFLGLTGIITLERSAVSADRLIVSEAGWTERAANEIWFARPRFEPPADLSLLIDVLYEEWIKKQQRYHNAISDAYRKRSSWFQAASIGLFSLSAAAALLHSVGAGSGSARLFRWWDFLAIAVPAAAGALSGYAAQRDYIRHAERSKHFASTLERALDQLLSARSLSEIQQAALNFSRSMRGEATDWYSVVHSQDVELPS
jgi:SMODS and SLOG-associating 2TM effector domain 3